MVRPQARTDAQGLQLGMDGRGPDKQQRGAGAAWAWSRRRMERMARSMGSVEGSGGGPAAGRRGLVAFGQKGYHFHGEWCPPLLGAFLST